MWNHHNDSIGSSPRHQQVYCMGQYYRFRDMFSTNNEEVQDVQDSVQHATAFDRQADDVAGGSHLRRQVWVNRS